MRNRLVARIFATERFLNIPIMRQGKFQAISDPIRCDLRIVNKIKIIQTPAYEINLQRI